MRVSMVFAGLAAIVGASPVVHPRQGMPTSTLAPCAQVSQALYGNSSSPGPVPTMVPAQLAYDCLNTIPLNVTSAKALLWELPIYFNWQSTLDVLKNPPQEYVEKVQPAVDILAGLEQISADIDANKFDNEYEFGWALYTLVQSAHDGHFSYIPDVVGYIFNFGRPVPLVSVSDDGKKLPAVFAYSDVLGMQFKNISYTPSPVTEIDGQEVYGFLEDLSQTGSLQDRDALYNNLFYNLAQVSLGTAGSGTGGFSGGGRGRYVYPGPTTTLKFANGTEYTMNNYARTTISWRDVESGEQLAERIITYGNTASAASMQLNAMSEGESNEVSVQAVTNAGYPSPVVQGPAHLINGFYIDDDDYKDVAVLQVPNFVGVSSAETSFQATSRKFLAQAVADGKTKLVIDLQANGGGTIMQGYDLFKQLFPDMDPYGANRFRYNEVLDLIGQSFSAYASQFPRDSMTDNYTIRDTQSSFYDYHTDMKVDGSPFTSWDEKAGPVTVNGANYTQLTRWNLSDVYIPFQGGINITGYGVYANVTGPPRFKAEDIVLLTDGYCASTCTIFSELMTQQAGVKTIALGGRSHANKIQAIGGVKGVNNYQMSYIRGDALDAIYDAAPEVRAEYDSSVLNNYRSMVAITRSYTSGLNVRDGLRLNDTSGIALQFIYEEADCRLFYTPEMTVDATSMWKAAVDAHWSDASKCVGSGIYSPSSMRHKRAAHVQTAQLSSPRVQMHGAKALSHFEALEKSLSLETEYQPEVAGFMQP